MKRYTRRGIFQSNIGRSGWPDIRDIPNIPFFQQDNTDLSDKQM